MRREVFSGVCRLFFLVGCLPLCGYSAEPDQASSPSTAPLPSTAWPLPPLSYFIEHLPPPPHAGSFRDRMDLGDVLARQKGTNQEDLDSIQQTYLFKVFYFSKVLGPNFNARNYPKTEEFFFKLTETTDVVVKALKNYYQRPRPFEGHPDQVKLLVKNEPGFGYPSGHTTRSRLAAFVMTELAPEYKKQFYAAADQVATDRILAGEHYLTDLEAGHRLGKMIFLLLSEDPQFQSDLAALKAEEWTPAKTALNPPKP